MGQLIKKFYGYANVFSIQDDVSDIILPLAFKNTLKEKNLDEIKLLWQHNQNCNIGFFTKIYEDNIGLFIEGNIELNSELNKEIYNLVNNDIINGLSIGFIPKNFKFENEKRVIYDLELLEISIVKNPANKYSKITYCNL